MSVSVWLLFRLPAGLRALSATMRARACLQAALPGFAGVAALKRVAQDPSVVRNKRALALHSLGQCAPTDDMVRAPPTLGSG